MTNKVIVDTNIIVGLYDKKDVWHAKAKELMKNFKVASFDLILLDCVANETFTVLVRRLESKGQSVLTTTLKKLRTALPKNEITRSYQILETHYEEVIDRIIDSKGKINFHDALIITFAVSQNIPFIASFDEDFDGISGVTRISDPNTFQKI